MFKRGITIDGIAIVSDGGENNGPYFDNIYRAYCNKYIAEPSVYHLWVPGDPDSLSFYNYVEKIDLSKGFDEYAFSNLTNILKANKYDLIDEIINTPLLTFNKVFKE